MAKEINEIAKLKNQVKGLKLQLAECQDTLQAIQTGEVDALVVRGQSGEQIYTLKDAERPYRVMVETMSEGACTLAPDGTIFYCNNQLASLLKAPLNKIITAPLFDFVSPSNFPALQSILERVSQSSDRTEMTLINSEGASVPVLISTRALNGNNQQMISMIITDLSAHKHTEQLIASEKFSQVILEQAADAIIVCDIDGTVLRASDKAVDLFGMALKGVNFDLIFNRFNVVLADDNSSLRETTRKPVCLSALRKGDIKSGSEIELINNDQTKSTFIINFSGLSKERTILGYSISLTDITERNKIEQLKDEFIGMVSHELKTPLTVIIGALSTAADKRISSSAARVLYSDAVLHANILANIVDNLLELSRKQSERLDLQIKPVDIGKIAMLVREKLQGKSTIHHLIDEFASELPQVNADSIRVERILYNLVENAIKYSPRGGNVKVSARQDGGYVVVSVSDQGPGISKENQALLFKSFERLGSRVHGSIQGTGLGLRVCRILVEAQHGKIWVESDEGQGTTFYFTLPVAAKSHAGFGSQKLSGHLNSPKGSAVSTGATAEPSFSP